MLLVRENTFILYVNKEKVKYFYEKILFVNSTLTNIYYCSIFIPATVEEARRENVLVSRACYIADIGTYQRYNIMICANEKLG